MTAARAACLLGVAATTAAGYAAAPLPLWRLAVVLVATLVAGLAGVLIRHYVEDPS